MPKGRWSSISIREQILARAHKTFEKEKEKNKKPELTFTDWINTLIWDVLEEKEELFRYAPALEYIGISDADNTIVIKDHFEDRLVEIEPHVDKKLLYCRYCSSSKCLHVGFCYAVKDVNKRLIELGFK